MWHLSNYRIISFFRQWLSFGIFFLKAYSMNVFKINQPPFVVLVLWTRLEDLRLVLMECSRSVLSESCATSDFGVLIILVNFSIPEGDVWLLVSFGFLNSPWLRLFGEDLLRPFELLLPMLDDTCLDLTLVGVVDVGFELAFGSNIFVSITETLSAFALDRTTFWTGFILRILGSRLSHFEAKLSSELFWTILLWLNVSVVGLDEIPEPICWVDFEGIF